MMGASGGGSHEQWSNKLYAAAAAAGDGRSKIVRRYTYIYMQMESNEVLHTIAAFTLS